jgi:hypothetical protein
MAKVRDVFPDSSPIRPNAEWIKGTHLSDMWAKYDEETDSMLIYVTGQPVPGVNVYLKDDIYAIVDLRDQNKMVGLYFEAWEEFAKKLDIVNRSWGEIRENLLEGTDTSLTLRFLALVLVTMMGKENSPALEFA